MLAGADGVALDPMSSNNPRHLSPVLVAGRDDVGFELWRFNCSVLFDDRG